MDRGTSENFTVDRVNIARLRELKKTAESRANKWCFREAPDLGKEDKCSEGRSRSKEIVMGDTEFIAYLIDGMIFMLHIPNTRKRWNYPLALVQ